MIPVGDISFHPTLQSFMLMCIFISVSVPYVGRIHKMGLENGAKCECFEINAICFYFTFTEADD